MYKTITVGDFLRLANKHYTKDKPIFCDIETDGLYVNTSLIQFRQDGLYHMVTTTSDQAVEKLKEWMEDKWLVWWNAPYDLGTLNFEKTPRTDDLWVAFKIAYPSLQEFTLDKAVSYLGYKDLYEGLDKKALQKAGFVRNAYMSQDQLRYAAADVEALERMWQIDKIQKVMQGNMAYRLAIYAIEEAMVWQQNGIPMRQDVIANYMIETQDTIDRLDNDLLHLAGDGFNPRSPKQVKELLGIASSDKATLTRIIINGSLDSSKKSSTGRGIEQKAVQFTERQQKQAEVILAARKAKNDMSKLIKYNHPILYGRFSPVGAGTSRWSCKGSKHVPEYDNLQNYSRQFKSCFGLPDDSDMIIVAADFATLEIRIAAAIMNEPNMYAALMRGDDIHKTTASLVYNKPIEEVHGRERSNAKVMNFGLTYGMGLNVFIQYAFDLYGIKFSIGEAKDIIARFFKAYPGLKEYHTMVGNKMRKGSYICQTALGYRMKPKMYAEAINGPTQGTGGETMRLAIHLMYKKDISTLKYLVNSIHDAAYLIVPKNDKDYWSKLLHDSMQEAWYEIRKSKVFYFHDIPMPVDIMSGQHMGDLEEGFAGGGQALSVEEMRETQARNKK